MFHPLPAGSALDTSLDRAVGLQRSVNMRPVVHADGAAASTRAHVVGVCDQSGSYWVYIVLTPAGGGSARILQAACAPMALADYPRVERAALDRVEQDGFVMERVGLLALTGTQRAQVRREIPFGRADVELQVTLTSDVPAPPSPGSESGRSGATLVSDQESWLGITPQEAISSLGRLLAIF
jgi:hypothetical protein